jgi:microcystin-dependent protein
MAENFDLIFGQNASQQYAWSDSDYQDGWETVGNIPPTAAQFDALQRRNDTKMKELNDNLTPLVNANAAETRQPATAYNVGDMKYSPLLPTGWFLSCVVAGTTSAGEIVLPSPVVENASVVDGTVTWQIRKIGSGGGEAVGVIKAFAGNGDIPSGYLLCDGSAVSRTMFPDLFSAIGTTYGSGDGSTTFNLPDFNTAARFAQGSTVAGVEKNAGLPNITGVIIAGQRIHIDSANNDKLYSGGGAFVNASSVTEESRVNTGGSNTTGTSNRRVDFDASRSNPIYGASETVQPESLTTRYIIKAFDGQTADSALVDITQYAQELAGKANITGSNMVHHRDVITTSGTYTAPVTGLYKITVKGGGGGGQGGGQGSSSGLGGNGGGEGGTTIAYERLEIGDTATVIVGAGGTGGAKATGVITAGTPGGNGGDSSVTVNSTTYTGGGGQSDDAGVGNINGAPGGIGAGVVSSSSMACRGGSGGGAGGGRGASSGAGKNGTKGGGGGGGAGSAYNTTYVGNGGNGGDGYVWFEYYTPGA